MDKQFHLLAAYLLALESYCKDIHYYCKDFGTHLFADVEMDDLAEFRDQLFENVMLGSHVLPYSSQKYLAAASVMVPPISVDDEEANIRMLSALIEMGVNLVNSFEGATRGQNALLDEIAGHLDKAHGLCFLLLRKYGEQVQESVKVEHCKGCVQRAVDRAKAILAKINYDEVAKTVLDYSNQHAAMCEEVEEDTLDKLSKKLGV